MIDRRTNYLTAPPFTADEALTRPSPIPQSPGVYGWWFRTIPHPEIDTSACETRDGLTPLYAGISPSRPPTNGKPASSQNIRRRIRTHYRGNAEGSTLRKTLGCLLSNELGIELRRVGSGNRRLFHAGEKLLTQWMAANAFVSWVEHPEPWVLEDELIADLDLPLNLHGNRRHPFHPVLSEIRREAVERANKLGVV